MISSIASAYAAAADHGQAEPHLAWRRAWERLREDWQSGQRPALQDLPGYLSEVPPDELQEATCDLVSEHLRLTWQAGCGSTLDDYGACLAREFLWLADRASIPADLVEDEFGARSLPPHGDQPTLADYVARFPNRADVMDRLNGRCLGENRYIKLRVLGTGLLGVVHQGLDRVEQRLVAIKEAPRYSDGENCTDLLFHEAKLTAELDHPNIVPIYDVGLSRDRAFYVMAFIAGKTLAEQIRDYHTEQMSRTGRENRRRLDELIRCVIQISDAVAHAHEHGILHRDIKPGNVIVDDSGKATIVDWGLARRLEPASNSPIAKFAPNSIVGTPQYLAPEQVDGGEEPASDIFSLGAVLCEVFTGRPPYDWPAGQLPCDWQQTLRQTSLAPRIRQARIAAVPKSILTRSLAKSPADRYRTAAELAAELQRYLDAQDKSRRWFFLF